MKYLTNQQILDKVSLHLLTQNSTAAVNGSCRCRTKSGKSCAVGCLITNKLYTKEIEGTTVYDNQDILSNILKKSGIRRASFPLLEHLQGIHDGHYVKNWKSDLLETAKQFKLKPPKVLTK